MMVNVFGLIGFLFILFLCWKIYVAIRSPFWSKQPVYHVGDWFLSPHIIRPGNRQKDRYVRLSLVHGTIQDKIDTFMLSFLRNHYLSKEQLFVEFRPESKNIIPYFSALAPETALLTWHENRKGMITSRKMKFRYGNQPWLSLYYVDYLCVHSGFRKKNIATELIATHEYHQSKHCSISLFKREEVLTWGVVPLCEFATFTFDLRDWRIPPLKQEEEREHIMIGASNYEVVVRFLEAHSQKFKVAIFPANWGVIADLLRTENVYVSMLLNKGCFFFRKTCVYFSENHSKDLGQGQVLDCFASIWLTSVPDASIKRNLELGLYSILKNHPEEKYTLLSIENISDNHRVLTMCNTYSYLTKRPTAYYFYNFIHPKVESKKVIFLG